MPRSQRLTLTLAMAGAVALVASRASAQSCGAGCTQELRACVQTARTTLAACRVDCRTNASPADHRTCMRGCSSDFRTARAGCGGDLTDCLGSCAAPPDAPSAASCLGGCGQDLGGCAQGVVATARACIAACRTADDRLSCLQACAADAHSGATGCGTDFTTCRAGCGGPTTTSTTLPPPVPSCESAEAPACGGSCPSADETCGPVGPTRCACMPGSPAGAFVH